MYTKRFVAFALLVAILIGVSAADGYKTKYCGGMRSLSWNNPSCSGEPISVDCEDKSYIGRCVNGDTGSVYERCASVGEKAGLFTSAQFPVHNCNATASQTISMSVGVCMVGLRNNSAMHLCAGDYPAPTKFPSLLTKPSPGPPVPTQKNCPPGFPESCESPLSYVTWDNEKCEGAPISAYTTMQWPDICYSSDKNLRYSCKDGVLRMEYLMGCDVPSLYSFIWDLENGYSPCMNRGKFYCAY